MCRARDFWKGVLGLSEISSANYMYFKTLRILLSVTVTDTLPDLIKRELTGPTWAQGQVGLRSGLERP